MLLGSPSPRPRAYFAPYVESISPHLIFEYVTDVPGYFCLRTFGSPSSGSHGPFPPASSHRIHPSGWFQMLMTSTIPLASDSPIPFMPPCTTYVVPSSHRFSVMEFPRPDDACGFWMTLPSCTHSRRISTSRPADVLSEVKNCVTTVNGRRVSMVMFAEGP